MSAKPRYIYFNIKGRGELPRLVCAAGGVDFVDERITLEQWGAMDKSNTPFSQVPCLVIGEEWYAQKLAISLYFAKQCGLYPTSGNDTETLKMAQDILFLEDILEKIIKAHVDKQFNNQPDAMAKVKDEVLLKKLPMAERLLKNSGTGFYVGNKLSLVDIQAFDLIEQIVSEYGQDAIQPYPLIQANFEKVGQTEGIKQYVKNRPPPLDGFNW